MASKQINNDCPPQEDPENPDFVCANCCTNTVELCDGCYERYIAIHSRENSQNDPDPPTLPVSANLLNSEIPRPSTSGSGNQSTATLEEVSKTRHKSQQQP